MIYVIAPPVQALNSAMNTWLNGMRGANAVYLGLVLGGMMAFDMGGPVNKAAYTFAVGLLASKIYTPMAAVIAAGMTPPLGLALATILFKNRFDLEEREAGGPAFVLGLSFITEGAIPFAAKDPFHVIPATMLGSAVAGAISMSAGAQFLVPHGGIFRRAHSWRGHASCVVSRCHRGGNDRHDRRALFSQATAHRSHSARSRRRFLTQSETFTHDQTLTATHPPRRARRNKEEAIRAAGQVLVDSGHIAPGYVESMLGREGQANTYLGNGIAIPHGMQKDRELIRQTGVSVVQLPDGVEWNEGQTVRIVVGIAAKSDEHLGILSALTDVLDDAKTSRRLAETDDPQEIIAGLSRRTEAEISPAEKLADAKDVEVVIAGSAGLHARPATFFVDVANQFEAEIFVRANGKLANGKAMASLLKLGAAAGSKLQILANGPDADAALAALKAAVESGLGDEEEPETVVDEVVWTPVSSAHWIGGVSASPGIAIGLLHHFQSSRLVVDDKPEDVETEKQKLKYALEVGREQLVEIHDAVKSRCGRNEAAIFRAHQAFLTDVDLFSEVYELIEAGHSAAWSWQKVIDQRVAEVEQVANERLAGRAADLHDVGQRVLRLLTGTQQGEVHLPNEPVILVAEDLTPSDSARLDPKRILGLCTASGGATSHTAIIARSLDIPAIVGAGAALFEQKAGALCILDGSTGRPYARAERSRS